MFIKRQECEEQKKLPVDVGKCENILNFLQQFPIAKMTYLEFLVKQKKLQVSFKLLIVFHTLLKCGAFMAYTSSNPVAKRSVHSRAVAGSENLGGFVVLWWA